MRRILTVIAALLAVGVGSAGIAKYEAQKTKAQVGALRSEIDSLQLDPANQDCAPRDQALYSDVVRRRGDLEASLGKGSLQLVDLDKFARERMQECRRQQFILTKAKLDAVNEEIGKMNAARETAARRSAAFKKWYEWDISPAAALGIDAQRGAAFDDGIRKMERLWDAYQKLYAEEVKEDDEPLGALSTLAPERKEKLQQMYDQFDKVKLETIAPFYVK